jgi:predicted N-formylglutamate amidohydrolase
MAKPFSLLITCEHGGNRIPPRYRHLFKGHEELLQSHRGYDPGALLMAKEFAAAFKAPLFVSTVSRLLIELNRSIGHPKLYSDATRNAPPEVRQEILAAHYLPYRSQVESHIAGEIAKGRCVIHISSHSFTPVLDGEVRNADIGLLYDPARPVELEMCRRWQSALKVGAPQVRVRRNYPYAGTSDGFTVYLRKRFAANVYAGIELEINQKWAAARSGSWRKLRLQLVDTLKEAMLLENGRK